MTERKLVAQGRYVDDIDVATEPGAFTFYTRYSDPENKIAGLLFKCPCGCGDTCGINFHEDFEPRWDWDGNKEKPTVSPSIQRIGDCKWHGWFEEGRWVI